MPSKLQTLSADSSAQTLADALRQDGALIVRDVLSSAMLDRIDSEFAPLIERAERGRDDFTGRSTKRIGALVARSPACRDVVMNPLILGAANDFLGPYCEKIQLHLTQVIDIEPGQGAQALHRDRLAWGGYLPKPIEPQFNTIWALTDFTADNGATHVVPGSHDWPLERNARPQDTIQAEMTRGSVLLYSGTVIHGGGANAAQSPRIGLNITYCLGWLRQEENQFLSCPPDVARELDPDLTDLLGYSMGNYALGYYSEPQMLEGKPDTLPPQMALGRKPAHGADEESLLGELTARQRDQLAGDG
jgi:ectoine hydroxylase-related dioxygenase (phytanoyl-CoA dioxygenase family)